jgi:hypothetical protein
MHAQYSIRCRPSYRNFCVGSVRPASHEGLIERKEGKRIGREEERRRNGKGSRESGDGIPRSFFISTHRRRP